MMASVTEEMLNGLLDGVNKSITALFFICDSIEEIEQTEALLERKIKTAKTLVLDQLMGVDSTTRITS